MNGASRVPAASTGPDGMPPGSAAPSPGPGIGAPGTAAPRFVLCAGESSGDLLGAGLIEGLRERWPQARFAGIGGDAMRRAGCETWFDASELAVMGLAEVLRHLPRLLRLRREFRERALAWRPDVFVGIDAPDFNLGVERWLKQRGVHTVHYVSPSVWAWREKRAEKIGASADRVLCLFPMEPPIYARHGIDARFVGHPMADAIPLRPDPAAARRALGLPEGVPVLAVLPGSRLGEVSRLAPDFLQAAWQVSERLRDLHVVIPAANADCRALLAERLAGSPLASARTHLLDGQGRTAMAAADVVLLASGTATLEAMLLKRPMVVAYRVSAATYRIVKALGLIKVDRFALPNLLAGRDLVPELIQHACTPERLAAAVLHWFEHPEAVAALQPAYRRVHEELRRDASRQAAAAVAELVGPPAGAGA